MTDRLITPAVLTAAVFLPLVLVLNWSNVIRGTDWQFHELVVNLVAQGLRHHHSFPSFLSTDVIIGAPNNLFYATYFYYGTGLLAALLGSNIAIRLVLVVAFVIQTWCVYRTASIVTGDRWLSYAITVAVNASIYPLTNLYSRGDLTEFTAIALLTAAVAVWLRLTCVRGHERWYVAGLTALFMSMAAMTAPLVLLMGNGLLGLVMLLTLFVAKDRFSVIAAGALVVGLELLIISPWLYSYLTYEPFMGRDSLWRAPTYIAGIDDLTTRLWPFPHDGRMSQGGVIPTPNLDAQINLVLIGMAAALAFLAVRGRSAGGAAAAAGVCLLLVGGLLLYSTSPALGERFHVLGTLQYAYRLVAYIDILSLAGLLFLTMQVRARAANFIWVFAVVGLLSTQLVLLKDLRANVAERSGVAALSVRVTHLCGYLQPTTV